MIVPHATIRERVVALFRAGGLPKGSLTGWPSVDRHYTVGLSQWTLITGVPHSGKSEWLDALMVNLAKRESWRFFIYSPENWPLELHHSKILEKYLRKPFGPGPTPRMDEEDVEAGEEWMRGKFHFCEPDRPDICSIIEEASSITAISDTWKTGIVVDPWNQLDHYRPTYLSEAEYISQTLSDAIKLVRKYNVHLWLVAHPRSMLRDRDGKYPVPTPRDVAGGAHWWAKSDNCITIHREQVDGKNDVDIHIQKVRHKHMGRIGLVTLQYDRVTGCYSEKLAAVKDYRDHSNPIF